jgi:hypothetical protein
VYELIAWGLYNAQARPANLVFDARWTGATDIPLTGPQTFDLNALGALIPASGTPPHARWRTHTLIQVYTQSLVHGQTMLHLGLSNDPLLQAPDFISAGTAPVAVDLAGDAIASIWVQFPDRAGSGSLTLQGSKAWKAG